MTLASPISIPPSKNFPSLLILILLYIPLYLSSRTIVRQSGSAIKASPKLATSTPINFSFVLISKPVNDFSVPHKLGSNYFSHFVTGSYQTIDHSIIQCTFADGKNIFVSGLTLLVHHDASAVSDFNPAAFANSSRGLIPAEITSMSIGKV